ncbi:MAG TPA: M14 metallopeptidase family protein [Vicinamibacterales bacterium]|nr:M14 metallopeptidase family protein [Vicinamibacterales bacterium]
MAKLRRGLMILVALVGVAAAATVATRAQTAAPARQTAAASGVSTPKDEWGHNVGDDYFLADYKQLDAYWHKLEKQSNRIHIVEIGKTAENRPHLMAIITAPENYAKLDRYRQISAQLSNAQGLTDAQAHDLAREGKAVVWIDGGLHATETLGAQQLLEMVYQMVSRTDAETQRFLNDVILLCTLANPDGMDLVSDWYMQHGSMGVPRLWNHYAGHDDNRDSFMNALPETTNVSRVMYREWYPQIMYNHHQAGPAGSVMFAPPFRDPFNYNFHPEIPADVDLIGAVMAARFIEEGKPGVVNRKGQPYSTWWNGGFRTTAYFHNQIGILTETVGSPDPSAIPFTPRFAVPEASWWWPIQPQQVWHFRQSIDYSITANRAVIDFASKYRETLLYRIYQMGRDEIQWGSEDHWTFTPHKTAAICVNVHKTDPGACAQIAGGASALPNNGRSTGAAGRGGAGGGGGGGRGGGDAALYAALTTKELRDPRGYIMPSDQPDFGSAVAFVNALIKSGVTVLKATAPFSVNGKQYPANSLVIKTAQAFRPHVLDMFEPQDYPDDFDNNGNPVAPYDDAGWTLAYQMGVKFDRILDGFDGPFQKVDGFAKAPAGAIKTAQAAPVGYYFSHENTYSFVAINRLLAAGEDVSWLASGPLGTGTFYVAAKPTTLALLQKASTDLGVSFQATTTAPTGAMSKLRKLRIGLVDTGSGGMPVGWTRLIFKNFEFPYVDGAIDGSVNDIYGPDINAGNLNAKFDVIVFNNVAIGAGGGRGGFGRGGGGANAAGGDQPPAGGAAGAPAAAGGGRGGRGGGQGGRGAGGGEAAPGDTRPRPFQPVPEIYAKRQGGIDAQGEAALKQFVQSGGTVIVIGNAADSAVSLFSLPLTRHDTGARTDFYAPSSVFELALDPKQPLAHGYGDKVDIFYSNNVMWDLNPNPPAGSPATHAVGWFASAEPLRSGWAWGQKVMDKGVEIVSADVGQGHVFLFGNELTNRSQPQACFKLFFNALYLSVARY